jgi:hypothetical protein
MEQPKSPSPTVLWRYPLKWVRREAFWHDLFVNLLATSIAAAVGFVALRAGGQFSDIHWSTVGRIILTWAAIISAIVVAILLLVGVALTVWEAVSERKRNVR